MKPAIKLFPVNTEKFLLHDENKNKKITKEKLQHLSKESSLKSTHFFQACGLHPGAALKREGFLGGDRHPENRAHDLPQA